MHRHIIISLAIIMFALSGCSDGITGYLQKSANNKWIDAKGFSGSKRKPLYNKKYIALAKRNITSDNLDEDEDTDTIDEELSSLERNRQMYWDMIKHNPQKRNQKNIKSENYHHRIYTEEDDNYPSLADISKKISKETPTNQALQKELTQIKAMLTEAKRDLARYKCPLGESPINTENNKRDISASQNSQNSNTNPDEVVTNNATASSQYKTEDASTTVDSQNVSNIPEDHDDDATQPSAI